MVVTKWQLPDTWPGYCEAKGASGVGDYKWGLEKRIKTRILAWQGWAIVVFITTE